MIVCNPSRIRYIITSQFFNWVQQKFHLMKLHADKVVLQYKALEGLRVLAIAWAWVSIYIYVRVCVCLGRLPSAGVCGKSAKLENAHHCTCCCLGVKVFYIFISRLNLGDVWMPTLFVVQWLNLNSLPLKRLLTQSLWHDCVERLMGKL